MEVSNKIVVMSSTPATGSIPKLRRNGYSYADVHTVERISEPTGLYGLVDDKIQPLCTCILCGRKVAMPESSPYEAPLGCAFEANARVCASCVEALSYTE